MTPLDLDGESRRVLDFDALLELVASHAATAPGADRVRAARPVADLAVLAEARAEVEEVARHLEVRARLVPVGLPDPRSARRVLDVPGAVAEPKPLRDLCTVLAAAHELRAACGGLAVVEHPRLAALGRGIPDLAAELKDVLRWVDPAGQVADGASAELGRLRAVQARLAERLQRLLTRILRSPEHQPAIRDAFVTRRNERFVVPVRSDAPRPLAGIVHASSSSGATLFVEPLETVEMNNELVRLAEAEREELLRILAGWTERLRVRAGDVDAALDGLARIDQAQARALFGRELGGILAEVAEGGEIELAGLCHPLLERQLRERGERSVPLDLRLAASDRVFVLSGPNTGGKTVALKTLGLTAVMAQCAIPVPASRARMPLYRQLRADIGDHQSIAASLSTYSAHVRAVASFLAEVRPPALVLFDEPGGGTDPAEGAALAQAALEALASRGAFCVVTTHQEALKAWALTTPGAAAAAMEYDAETLRPTYRLVLGAAGRSAGLDIAERLGLAPEVVAAARARLSGERGLAESYAERLRELTAEAGRRTLELAGERRAFEAERARARAEAEREAERARARFDERTERVIRELRREVAAELARIEDERERRIAERRAEALERTLRSSIERTREEIAPMRAGEPEHELEIPEAVEPGMRVRLSGLGQEGVIVAARGDRIEVRLGAMTTTVGRSELRVLRGAPLRHDPGDLRQTRDARRRSPATSGGGSDDLDPPSELLLLGLTVEEALAQVDRFLDASTLAGRSEVRVVHGHGTGRLRRAVRAHLAQHVQVQSQRPGRAEEGGDGATVVTLG